MKPYLCFSIMLFFNFHYHHSSATDGIRNLDLLEPPEKELFSAGIHPQDLLMHPEESWKWLQEVSGNQNCVAIGECGLDGMVHIDDSLQEAAFRKQIALATHLQKPMIIHCVRRFSRLIYLKKNTSVPMIVHGFNRKESIATDLLNAGFSLSFGKAVFHNVSLQQILKKIPVNRMFLETDDCDFDIRLLYQITAELKEISLEKLANGIEDHLKQLKLYGKNMAGENRTPD